ncbi:hypothetical protein KKH43_04525 [Patescibacteria group bacterium]|nr:hypothetical protein [Patescibacteria group bacterium]
MTEITRWYIPLYYTGKPFDFHRRTIGYNEAYDSDKKRVLDEKQFPRGKIFRAHEFSDIAVSNEHIAVVNKGGILMLFDIETEKCLSLSRVAREEEDELPDSRKSIASIGFSPNGQYLYCISHDLKVFEIQDNKLNQTPIFTDPDCVCRAHTFSSSSQFFVYRVRDGYCKLDLKTGNNELIKHFIEREWYPPRHLSLCHEDTRILAFRTITDERGYDFQPGHNVIEIIDFTGKLYASIVIEGFVEAARVDEDKEKIIVINRVSGRDEHGRYTRFYELELDFNGQEIAEPKIVLHYYNYEEKLEFIQEGYVYKDTSRVWIITDVLHYDGLGKVPIVGTEKAFNAKHTMICWGISEDYSRIVIGSENDPSGLDRHWLAERVINFFDTEHNVSKEFIYTSSHYDSEIVGSFLWLFRDTEFSEAYSLDDWIYLESVGLYVQYHNSKEAEWLEVWKPEPLEPGKTLQQWVYDGENPLVEDQ